MSFLNERRGFSVIGPQFGAGLGGDTSGAGMGRFPKEAMEPARLETVLEKMSWLFLAAGIGSSTVEDSQYD